MYNKLLQINKVNKKNIPVRNDQINDEKITQEETKSNQHELELNFKFKTCKLKLCIIFNLIDWQKHIKMIFKMGSAQPV